MTKSVLFYVMRYNDHLNEITPEHPVLFRKHNTPEKRSTPYVMTRYLRNGDLPGIETMTLGDEFEGWEYWVCNWTGADMAAMNIAPEFVATDAYVDQWPDVWHIDGLMLNAKAREAFEKHAPDAFLYFPVEIFSKVTGEPVGDARWRCVPRHWFQVAGEKQPLPLCDFDPSVTSALFRTAQKSPQIAAFLNDLQCFSKPGGSAPTFSPDLFHKLTGEGLTGLQEKTSPSITFHELREVVAHVWSGS